MPWLELLVLAFLSTALLGGVVEAWPSSSYRLRGRRSNVDDGQSQRGSLLPTGWLDWPPWIRSISETTTAAATTLTLSKSEQTSLDPSPTPFTTFTITGTPSPSSASTALLSTTILTASSVPDARVIVSSSLTSTVEAPTITASDTMSTSLSSTLSEPPSPTEPLSNDASNSSSMSNDNRMLGIVLGSTLGGVILLLLLAILFYCLRRRRRNHRGLRLPFIPRGVSPIDDDEIERWKSPRAEKAGEAGLPTLVGDTDVEADAAAAVFRKETGHTKNAPSTASSVVVTAIKKPPSVIIYNNPPSATMASPSGRYSTDAESRPSFHQQRYHNSGGGGGSRKTSMDKSLPQTPIQARAPNSRPGLTDESVPGDDPFIMPQSPKRAAARLAKPPPLSFAGASGPRVHHVRGRSSRSSTRSFAGDYSSFFATGGIAGGTAAAGRDRNGSEVELASPGMMMGRYSHEHVRTVGGGGRQRSNSHHNQHYYNHDYDYQQQQQQQQQRRSRSQSQGRSYYHHSRSRSGSNTGGNTTPRSSSAPRTMGHSRVYSSSSIPPRLSFGEEMFANLGGLWPPPVRDQQQQQKQQQERQEKRGEEQEIGRAIG